MAQQRAGRSTGLVLTSIPCIELDNTCGGQHRTVPLELPHQGKGLGLHSDNHFGTAHPSRAWFTHIFNKYRTPLNH